MTIILKKQTQNTWPLFGSSGASNVQDFGMFSSTPVHSAWLQWTAVRVRYASATLYVLWPSVGSLQWAGHALWQCQGRGRTAGVGAQSCLGPSNGIRMGRPYGTCERDWGFWRLAHWVTRQSTVRNETGQGQTCVIGPQLARIMNVLADRGRRTHLCQRLSICPRVYVLLLCQPLVNLQFLETDDV